MTRAGWRPPVGMAEAVRATLQRLGLEAKVRQRGLWQVWDAVVGPQIARHAQPQAIQRGRLVVHVTDPVWLHQLSLMRHRLAASLNQALGEGTVRELVLRLGEMEAPPAPIPAAAAPDERPLDPARQAAIREAVAPLGDAPFREALERLLERDARTRKPPSRD